MTPTDAAPTGSLDETATGPVAPVRRALLSVSDKSGLEPLARALDAAGVALVSTGGTAAALRAMGLAVEDVSAVTGLPEMMDGRVKTLHPAIHGAVLARRDVAGDMTSLQEMGAPPIDLVVANLYPFQATVAAGAPFDSCVEQIDIGGPALIRAAAKNWAHVAVLTDSVDYGEAIAALDAHGGFDADLRLRWAGAAYARTAAYDRAIAAHFETSAIAAEPAAKADAAPALPGRLALDAERALDLRYGENPHQAAAFYADGAARPGVGTAALLQGKPLSFNNLNDTDAAFELVADLNRFDRPACVIVKHANPCGVALGDTLAEAYQRARDADGVSAFGGVVAVNRPLDADVSAAIAALFTEVVIAPGAPAEALAPFSSKPNVRVLETEGLPNPDSRALQLRSVAGGLLAQERDSGAVRALDLKVVTKRAPSPREIEDLLFAWTVAKHVKSNAIVYAADGRTVGVGAGQMSRVDAARIAARKAEEMGAALGMERSPAKGSVVASDAFFPFADGLIAAAEAGVTAAIQPGGSRNDAEVIEAADDAGLSMVFTNMRHFRH